MKNNTKIEEIISNQLDVFRMILPHFSERTVIKYAEKVNASINELAAVNKELHAQKVSIYNNLKNKYPQYNFN